jgi:Carboxypeptidase regulatory-like domain
MLFCGARLPAQEATQKHGVVRGTVSLVNASQEPSTSEGLQLELKPLAEGAASLSAVTDEAGNYEFKDVADGDYSLRLLAEGFEPFTATVHVRDGASTFQNISVRLAEITQRIEVREQAEPLSADSFGASKLSEKQLAALPLAEENFKASLPLTPGVVRTPDGKLNFRGAGEDQSMLQVNDSKMTDPVTGSFSIPVPLDAVQSARVVQTPYSAENGGFSGGLTVVETVPPPESWKFGVRDLNVSLRGKNDHFVGVGRATPRVVFGGPLFRDKISFSEVFEYDVIRDPVRGLAWPHNEVKKQGFNSYSTLQAILSPKQVVTVTLNVFPQRTQFANITALIPQTASSDYDRKGASASVSDVYTFSSGALFRMALNYTRFDSNAHGQGNEAMLLTPDGWGGNFFNSWARSSSQFQAAPTFQFAPRTFHGRHEIRIGVDATHRSFSGSSASQPVRLLREDGSLSEQIQFSGPGLLGGSVTDVEEFISDHWMLSDRLAADVGGRLTSQTVGRTAAFAPRFGIAYSPGRERKTILRAGTGIFYDRVPLLAADFAGNPTRAISQYDPSGQTVGNEVAFENEYIANGSGPIASRIRHAPNTSARSFVTSAEVDRALWTGAVLRLGYVHSTTRDLFVISPFGGEGGAPGVLGLLNTGRASYSQADATLRFHPIKDGDLSVSYIWSRSRGDLNTLGDVFIPFEQPVIRPNAYGVRPSDVPNRVVVWGTFRLPYALILGPVVDVHTGFPYSKVDERQNYVGIPNSQHFPTFFSLDFQVYRDFRIPLVHNSGSRKIRLGLYMINLTNHGNFSQVYNNVTSPQFGQFTGFERQKTAFLLSVVN